MIGPILRLAGRTRTEQAYVELESLSRSPVATLESIPRPGQAGHHVCPCKPLPPPALCNRLKLADSSLASLSNLSLNLALSRSMELFRTLVHRHRCHTPPMAEPPPHRISGLDTPACTMARTSACFVLPLCRCPMLNEISCSAVCAVVHQCFLLRSTSLNSVCNSTWCTWL